MAICEAANSRPRKLARLARAHAEEVDAPETVADADCLLGIDAMLRSLKTALLSLKTMTPAFVKWITGIATIASVLFVGFQYLDGRWKSRIERSLNLVMDYQNETTLKARNEIDLSDDPMIDINNQFECKAHDRNVALAQNDTSRIRGINIGDYNQMCQVNRCRKAIHDFANKRTGGRRLGHFNKNTSEIKYNEHGVLTKKILDLSDGEAIETEWGKVRAIGGEGLWWYDKGTAYDYSWPIWYGVLEYQR